MPPIQDQARIHVRIEGRVQGVYFRASAVERANMLNITGWVRNRFDGSVELVAEGSRAKLQELVTWCRQGPAGARVEKVEAEWQECCCNEFSEFRMRRTTE